jgi:hypothetical protein
VVPRRTLSRCHAAARLPPDYGGQDVAAKLEDRQNSIARARQSEATRPARPVQTEVSSIRGLPAMNGDRVSIRIEDGGHPAPGKIQRLDNKLNAGLPQFLDRLIEITHFEGN